MKWLKAALLMIVCIGVFVWAILFAIQNDQVVSLDLILLKLPSANIAIWIASSFGLGALIGVIVSALGIAKLKASKMRLQRQVKNRDLELDKLRTLPLLDQ